MSERKNPPTSIDAYKSLEKEDISKMYAQIMDALGQIGEGTFEDIAAYLKVARERVWKRLSEMERLEMIYRPGKKKLLKSNRNGFVWMLRMGYTPKTDLQENQFKKGTTSATDHAKQLIQNTQTTLFQ